MSNNAFVDSILWCGECLDEMDFVLLLKIFSISWLINGYNCEYESQLPDKHHGRFLFFPPIIPLNSFTKKRRQNVPQKQTCVGDSGFRGICSTKSDCTSNGGTSSGLCTDSTVCCINSRTCGSDSSNEVTYFMNPNFPDSYSGGTACKLKLIKSNPQICQLRIDFKEFSLSQPSNEGYCVNDFFTISDCLSYKLCGENKDQHIYVNFNEGSDALTFIVDTNSAQKSSRSWNMEIKQIACNDSSLAPSGCLMYYTGTSGTVSSFNYGDLGNEELKKNRQIRGMSYGVCIQSKNEFCDIEWSQSMNPYSFTISGNSSLLNSQQGTTNYLGASGELCGDSFIIIPNAYRNNQALNVDRFCGNAFNLTTTRAKPYVLYVVMGQNRSALSEDEGNRGFELNFRQLSCHN